MHLQLATTSGVEKLRRCSCAAGQLTSEVRSGYNVAYTYDANGNRISKTVNGVAESYTYDLADKMLARGRFTSVVEPRPGDKWL